jgi:hypothetical protein
MSTQTTSAPNGAFQYPPLPVGVDGIRICNIKPGEFSDPLICTLTPISFGNKPKYVALSYTWDHAYEDNAKLPTSAEVSKPLYQPAGDDQGRNVTKSYLSHQLLTNRSESGSKSPVTSYDKVPAITLNQQTFNVTHNLYLALLHVRSPIVPLMLWIDAICINQSDVNERNAQVANMSFIYMRATKVVGWLGTKEYNDRLGLFHSMSIEWKAGQSQHFATSLSQDGSLRCSLEPDQGTFARIANSSYWTRLWIVQEVCIPRQLIFVYGSNIWTYEDFTRWRALETAKSHQLSHSSLNKQTDALIRLSSARDARYTDNMRLENLIESFAGSRCSESRDRVYGLLGVANDISPTSSQDISIDITEKYISSLDMERDNLPEPNRGIGSFKVDYRCSLYDIWVDAVKFVFFRAKKIERNFGSAVEKELRDNTVNIKITKLFEKHERAIGVVRTAGLIQEAFGQKVEDEIVSPNLLKVSSASYNICYSLSRARLTSLKYAQIGPIIRAIGYLDGRIIQVGPEYESLVGSFRVHQHWVDSWEGHYDKPRDLEILRRMNEDYMIKTMAYERKDLDRIQEVQNSSIIAWRMGRNRPQSFENKQTSAWDFATGKIAAPSHRPRICLGTDYTIAMVPSLAKADDVIVRFWNCSAAVVMRPIISAAGSPPSSFLLVGRADIAEHLESHNYPGRDTRAEERLVHVLEPGVNQFQASGAVYVDLDFHALQLITASINSRRGM